MAVEFVDKLDLIQFLAKAGYTLANLPPFKRHYLILSPRLEIDEPIGHTDDRLEVLMQEPEMNFVEVNPIRCPFCQDVDQGQDNESI